MTSPVMSPPPSTTSLPGAIRSAHASVDNYRFQGGNMVPRTWPTTTAASTSSWRRRSRSSRSAAAAVAAAAAAAAAAPSGAAAAPPPASGVPVGLLGFSAAFDVASGVAAAAAAAGGPVGRLTRSPGSLMAVVRRAPPSPASRSPASGIASNVAPDPALVHE